MAISAFVPDLALPSCLVLQVLHHPCVLAWQSWYSPTPPSLGAPCLQSKGPWGLQPVPSLQVPMLQQAPEGLPRTPVPATLGASPLVIPSTSSDAKISRASPRSAVPPNSDALLLVPLTCLIFPVSHVHVSVLVVCPVLFIHPVCPVVLCSLPNCISVLSSLVYCVLYIIFPYHP